MIGLNKKLVQKLVCTLGICAAILLELSVMSPRDRNWN